MSKIIEITKRIQKHDKECFNSEAIINNKNLNKELINSLVSYIKCLENKNEDLISKNKEWESKFIRKFDEWYALKTKLESMKGSKNE